MLCDVPCLARKAVRIRSLPQKKVDYMKVLVGQCIVDVEESVCCHLVVCCSLFLLLVIFPRL
jgi:hypothetical protein